MFSAYMTTTMEITAGCILFNFINPIPPNIPDLEHQICQWTTNGSQEDLSNAGVFRLVWSHSWLCMTPAL